MPKKATPGGDADAAYTCKVSDNKRINAINRVISLGIRAAGFLGNSISFAGVLKQ